MAKVIFEQPNAPDEFGVALVPAELRRLDFTAMDFETLQRAGIEYIRSYFPNDFNDFFSSNGAIMFLELVSYIGTILSQRSDILIDEAFLPTAQTKDAVIEHLALINQKILRATPAVVDVEIALDAAAPSEVRIPAGERFTVNGPDNQPVYFELFRAPGDFVSMISIPPGKRGIIAYGLEGRTLVQNSVAVGGPGQVIDINEPDVLDEPVIVELVNGNVRQVLQRVAVIERAGPQDNVYEVRHLDGRTKILFGDDTAGRAPLSGQNIVVTYRVGGGVRGRIGALTINEIRSVTPTAPFTASVAAIFRNPLPSSGGTDEESIEQAKRRAPREFATHNAAITGEDYGLLASQFRHPVYGAVSKAIGVVRTGVDMNFTEIATRVRSADSVDSAVNVMKSDFVNRNIVELYVLSEGPDGPVKPSTGLKQGLITYFEDIKVLTDEVRVFDGAVKQVDIEATIVISRNADAGQTKVKVLEAISEFFNIRNFDMGTSMYLSNLYAVLQSISGVKYVNAYKPQDDIIQTNKLGDPASPGIGFNELITLGEVQLKFYYEPGAFRVPTTPR